MKRETERQRDRETERQRDRETERQKESKKASKQESKKEGKREKGRTGERKISIQDGSDIQPFATSLPQKNVAWIRAAVDRIAERLRGLPTRHCVHANFPPELEG